MSLITTITDQAESIAIASNALAHHPTAHNSTELLWAAWNAIVTIPHATATNAIGAAPLLIVAALIGRRTSGIHLRAVRRTRPTPRTTVEPASITTPF